MFAVIKKHFMFTSINIFRWTAFLEGVSYILLLLNMLIVKRFDLNLYKSLVYPIGMGHGLLFIAYIILAVIVGSKLKWRNMTLFKVLFASLIPLATFFINKKFLKESSNN